MSTNDPDDLDDLDGQWTEEQRKERELQAILKTQTPAILRIPEQSARAPLVPDYSEPLTGFRCWNVDSLGYLCSVNNRRKWPARRVHRAHCDMAGPKHFDEQTGALIQAPAPGCTCGYYAFKTDVPMTFMHEGYVTGKVKLWGRVIEHTQGYRSEFAYPCELQAPDARTAMRLQYLYGCPCAVKPSPGIDELTIDELIKQIQAFGAAIAPLGNIFGVGGGGGGGVASGGGGGVASIGSAAYPPLAYSSYHTASVAPPPGGIRPVNPKRKKRWWTL